MKTDLLFVNRCKTKEGTLYVG